MTVSGFSADRLIRMENDTRNLVGTRTIVAIGIFHVDDFNMSLVDFMPVIVGELNLAEYFNGSAFRRMSVEQLR